MFVSLYVHVPIAPAPIGTTVSSGTRGAPLPAVVGCGLALAAASGLAAQSPSGAGAWSPCLLENGSFEEVEEEELHPPGMAWWGSWGVPGWRPVERLRRGWTYDPDLFTPGHYDNFKGFQEPRHGDNYAGFAFGWNYTDYFVTEAFAGRLREPLEPGGRYRVAGFVSLADLSVAKLEEWPQNPPPRVELVILAPGAPEAPEPTLVTGPVSETAGWLPFEGMIEVPADAPAGVYRELAVRGYRARGGEPYSVLVFVYVDALSVCREDG